MYRVEVMEPAHPMDDIISRANLEPTIMEHLTRASIVFVPSICDGDTLAFPSGTNEFFQYCRTHSDCDVEICCNDADYCEMELCSFQIRLGKIYVKDIAVGVISGLISSYIFALLTSHEAPSTLVEQEYLTMPTVSFSIVVSDTTNSLHKEYKYEGPAEDVKEVTDNIISMWNEGKVQK